MASDSNPFPPGRYSFAWRHVHNSCSVLDFGCFEGRVLAQLRHDGMADRAGVDLNADAVARASQTYPNLRLISITKGQRLPFDDAVFDRVLLLDVIEHVHRQKELLDELRRVIKPDGRLVITVPGKHLFSFLDLGNLKFRFPELHRRMIVRKLGQEEYEYRYGSKNPFGLIGDVEREKAWHEHFSRKSLGKLLAASGFEPEMFDGTGYFARLYNVLKRIVPCAPFWNSLMRLDARLFHSTNLFCLARPINK